MCMAARAFVPRSLALTNGIARASARDTCAAVMRRHPTRWVVKDGVGVMRMRAVFPAAGGAVARDVSFFQVDLLLLFICCCDGSQRLPRA